VVVVFPAILRVGSATYTVRSKRLEGLFGRTLHVKALIELHKGQAVTQQRDTLVHEALHAVFNQAALAQHGFWSDDVEETLASTLAPWLLGLIRDNPELIEYLQEA
jgi:hypothetical protein